MEYLLTSKIWRKDVFGGITAAEEILRLIAEADSQGIIRGIC